MDLLWIRRFYPWVGAGLVVLLVIVSLPKLVEWNDDETYQIIEYPNGSVIVVDKLGFNPQWFGEVFTYPRYADVYFSSKVDEGGKTDGAIQVTFNDGGWGQTSNHLKIQMPVSAEERIALHRHFGRGKDKDVMAAVGHHLMNSLKNTGPLMSASEHQAQRKSEFYQVVSEQLRNGLYVMERVDQTVDRGSERTLTDDPEHQFITKIKRDKKGVAVIAAPSPLSEYVLTVQAYNQTGTEYDPETKLQISAKRESYQQAEQAKAATLNEQQKLFEVIEQGKLAVAGIEAEENKTKKQVLIKALQEQDVAKIEQEKAVTVAEQEVAVAGEQLKKAKTDVEISLIKVEQAKAEAAQLIATSEATQAKLEQGGALSERDQALAEFQQRRKVAIAGAVSKIPAPRVAILGGNGKGNADNGATGTDNTLMNLILLQQLDKKKE